MTSWLLIDVTRAGRPLDDILQSDRDAPLSIDVAVGGHRVGVRHTEHGRVDLVADRLEPGDVVVLAVAGLDQSRSYTTPVGTLVTTVNQDGTVDATEHVAADGDGVGYDVTVASAPFDPAVSPR
jgi:hypothetical protein